MKTRLLLPIACLTILSGCALAGPRPPSGIEQTFFTVVTNYVPIVTSTTTVLVVTNESGVTWVTNVIRETNWAEGYNFTPNDNAEMVAETGTTVGNFFGVGGIVGTLLTAAFGIWAKLRSNNAMKMAGVLAQIIEAGRKVLISTPQGQQLENQWVSWMSRQQIDSGVILEVNKLLKAVIDPESAKLAAHDLIELANNQPPK
jgi:hypothetical protein